MSLIDYSKEEQMLNDIQYIKKRAEFYSYKKDSLLDSIRVANDDVEVLTKHRQLIESAKQYYLKVVDKCYAYSINEMETFVNQVLSYVFYDEQYRIRLDITNKRNKSLTFYFIDDKKGLEVPLRKGNGKGVKAIVSFILLTYYLLRMKSPYLFMDESFVNISAVYIERFFDFVKKLCNDYGLCIVLITHDLRFPEYADVIYKVSKGVVTRVSEDERL